MTHRALRPTAVGLGRSTRSRVNGMSGCPRTRFTSARSYRPLAALVQAEASRMACSNEPAARAPLTGGRSRITLEHMFAHSRRYPTRELHLRPDDLGTVEPSVPRCPGRALGAPRYGRCWFGRHVAPAPASPRRARKRKRLQREAQRDSVLHQPSWPTRTTRRVAGGLARANERPTGCQGRPGLERRRRS